MLACVLKEQFEQRRFETQKSLKLKFYGLNGANAKRLLD